MKLEHKKALKVLLEQYLEEEAHSREELRNMKKSIDTGKYDDGGKIPPEALKKLKVSLRANLILETHSNQPKH